MIKDNFKKGEGAHQISHNWKLSTNYLESIIILSLVIVNPALFIISIISPALEMAFGLIRANVLQRKKKVWKQLNKFYF